MQRHLYKPFTLPVHSDFLHVSITDKTKLTLDKTDPSCPNKHEDYWIDTFKTKAPIGVNFDFDYPF